MISYYEKFRLLDEGKKHDFYVEVNWDKKNKAVKDCKLIKFTFPDGGQAIVKRELLNALLFTIARADEQREMIPVKVQPVHWKEVQVKIKATKDIRKGEDIIMSPFKISVPCDQTKEILGVDAWNKEVQRQRS